MSSSRRARRRRERQRAKRHVSRRSYPVATRVGVGMAGVAAIVAGVALLLHGGPQTATRLGRVAGVLMVLGFVAIVVALRGM